MAELYRGALALWECLQGSEYQATSTKETHIQLYLIYPAQPTSPRQGRAAQVSHTVPGRFHFRPS